MNFLGFYLHAVIVVGIAVSLIEIGCSVTERVRAGRLTAFALVIDVWFSLATGFWGGILWPITLGCFAFEGYRWLNERLRP